MVFATPITNPSDFVGTNTWVCTLWNRRLFRIVTQNRKERHWLQLDVLIWFWWRTTPGYELLTWYKRCRSPSSCQEMRHIRLCVLLAIGSNSSPSWLLQLWFKSLHTATNPSRAYIVRLLHVSHLHRSCLHWLIQVTYQAFSTIFIRLPYWVIIYLPKYWRPRPSWSLKCSVMVCSCLTCSWIAFLLIVVDRRICSSICLISPAGKCALVSPCGCESMLTFIRS